ncbi:phage minor capsid protein [Leucobacter sp. HY1910]
MQSWPGDSPQAWIDDVGHAIAERYRAIEDALYETLDRLTRQALEVPDDVLARYRAVQSLREQAERLVQTVNPDELARWATEQAAMGASAEIARVLLDFPAYAAMGVGKVTALTAGGAYAVAAVELDLRDSLRALNARILRAPVDAYQAMTSKHVASLLTGMTTSQALHRRILDEYLADGITGFIDKSGRRWTIGAYSEMAARTAAARAWRDQSVASMNAAGITTYTPVVGNSACDACARWIGKTLGPQPGPMTVKHAITAHPVTITVDATVDEWRGSGAGHPNCRCVLTVSLPGGPDPSKHSTYDKQKERDRERLRELERDVRAAKRDGDPDEIGEAQAALRQHVEETGIIRRAYREQLPFADGGDSNPRGRTKKRRR